MAVEDEDDQYFKDAFDAVASRQVLRPFNDDLEEEKHSIVSRVTGDLARGVLGSGPRSFLRGLAKGGNEIVDVATDLVSAIIPGDQDIDFNPFPVLAPPKVESVTGKLIEGVGQFAAGFGAVGKAVTLAPKLLGWVKALSKPAQAIVKGTAADLLAFDAHEARLSNIIQDVPELQNPITGYLAADSEDSTLEATLKQAIEGAALGGLGEGVFQGVKLLRKQKDLKRQRANEDGLGEPDYVERQKIAEEYNEELLGQLKTEVKKLEALKQEYISGARKPIDDRVEGIAKSKPEDSDLSEALDYGMAWLKTNADGTLDFSQDLSGRKGTNVWLERNLTRNEKRNIPTLFKELIGDKDKMTELFYRSDTAGYNDVEVRALQFLGDIATREFYHVGRHLSDPHTKIAPEVRGRIYEEAAAKVVLFRSKKLNTGTSAGRALEAQKVNTAYLGEPTAAERRAQNLISSALRSGNGLAPEMMDHILKNWRALDGGGGVLERLGAIIDNSPKRKAPLETKAGAIIKAWVFGLLTSPRTLIINPASNVLNVLSVGVEKSISGDHLGALAYWRGTMDSLGDTWRSGLLSYKSGQTSFGQSTLEGMSVPFDRSVLDPKGKYGALSSGLHMYGTFLNRYVGGSLAMGDEVTKQMAFKGELRAQATRQAHKELGDIRAKGKAQRAQPSTRADDNAFLAQRVSEITDNPTEAMVRTAREGANIATFTNDPEGIFKAAEKLIKSSPYMRLIVPFVRTPSNIINYTISRTPLGLLSKRYQQDIAAGGRRAALARAKVSLGTAVMFQGADMAMNGNITGAGPANSQQRAKLFATGWRPYSLLVGDTYYSYARLEPIGTWLGMAADLTEVLTNYESYDFESQREVNGAAAATIIALSNQVVGKTFLKGFADMSQLLANPKQSIGIIKNNYSRSLIPNVVADIERAISPETSQAFNGIDAIRARIPGMSDSSLGFKSAVPLRRNTYGHVIQAYYPSPNNLKATAERVFQIFNPFYFSDKDRPPSPLDEYFLTNDLTGPSMPAKTQTFSPYGLGRIKVDLRNHPEIYGRFMELRGEMRIRSYNDQTLEEYLSSVVTGQDSASRFFFHGFTDFGDQEDFVRAATRRYDDAIRGQLLSEYPEILTFDQKRVPEPAQPGRF